MGDVLSIQMQTPETTSETPTVATPAAPAIPEKFKDKSAAEIAAAYVELEKKLGSKPAETPAPTPAKTPETPAPETKVPANVDLSKYEAEFVQNGKLSDASYAELQAAGRSKTEVDSYIAGQQARNEQAAQTIFDSVGGKETYGQMIKWAATSLNAQETAAFNTAVAHADPFVAQLAVQGLAARYSKEYGSSPTLVTGSRTNTGNGFASVAEMTAAMQDVRYKPGPKQDPAYVKQIEQRVEASNW